MGMQPKRHVAGLPRFRLGDESDRGRHQPDVIAGGWSPDFTPWPVLRGKLETRQQNQTRWRRSEQADSAQEESHAAAMPSGEGILSVYSMNPNLRNVSAGSEASKCGTGPISRPRS